MGKGKFSNHLNEALADITIDLQPLLTWLEGIGIVQLRECLALIRFASLCS